MTIQDLKRLFKNIQINYNSLKTLERVQKQTEAGEKFNLQKLQQEGVRIESLCLPGLRVMPNSYSYSYLKKEKNSSGKPQPHQLLCQISEFKAENVARNLQEKYWQQETHRRNIKL